MLIAKALRFINNNNIFSFGGREQCNVQLSIEGEGALPLAGHKPSDC